MDILNWCTENIIILELIGAFAAVATAAAVIGALIKYLQERRRDKYFKQAKARMVRIKVNTQMDLIREKLDSIRDTGSYKILEQHKDSFLETTDEFIEGIATIGKVPEYIYCLRTLISDQSIWFGSIVSEWVKDLDNSKKEETDVEWASGAISGILTVMEDNVINDSDRKHLNKAFWSDISTQYFDDKYIGKFLFALRCGFKRERERWIIKSQKKNGRIKALVDYKVMVECALITSIIAESKKNDWYEKPRSEVFIKSMCIVWFILLYILQEQLVKTCEKLVRKRFLFILSNINIKLQK